MPSNIILIVEAVNFVFTIIFCLEALVKIIGFGTRYFYDGWNVFDFAIVLGSILFASLDLAFKIDLSLSA